MTSDAPRLRRRVSRRHVLGVVLLTVLLGQVSLVAPRVEATNPCPTPVSGVLDGTPPTFPRNVALTFDDGPSPRWTPQVLDILRRHGVRATFFVVGTHVEAYPWLVRQIVAEGHAIGNHTYSHANLDRLSRAAQAAEMDRATQAILAATGVRPCFFRGPYGTHRSRSVQELAWERGMSVAGWSHDSRDYMTPLAYSPSFQQTVVTRSTDPLVAHPTVLLHDGSPGNYRQNTVDAVERIVTFYAARGYVFTDPAGRPVLGGPIQAKYAQLGGPAGFLGHPVTSELRTPDGQGAFVHFQNGSVYWSPPTGAQEVHGAIRDTWARLGWERSTLGYPLTDETPTPDRTGRYNHFQRGSIYWSATTGAHEVRGDVRDTWQAAGGVTSPLGYPTSGHRVTPERDWWWTTFQGGAVYCSATTGCLGLHGPLHEAWTAHGAEHGALGYPLTGNHATPEGEAADFDGGRIVWNSQSGETEVVLLEQSPAPPEPETSAPG
jgi:peptidoglycan/xylan/chitin deacetylase (PgdA/CDA1 family)